MSGSIGGLARYLQPGNRQRFWSPLFNLMRVRSEWPCDARTFTGKVPRSQSTRKRVRQDIARWCEIHLSRLPKDGGAVILDLDYIWKPV